jgi:hypothetical protein
MEAKEILELIEGYKPYDDTKPEKTIIPRFVAVLYNAMETTKKIPNEVALHTLYHDYTLGEVKYNIQRAIRNLHLCMTLGESEVELPPIAASSGSADFIMGGIPFAICLTEQQFNDLDEEFKASVNCIVLEDYKANIEKKGDFILFKDISTTVLNVAVKIEEMIKKAQEDAEAADTADDESKEGE